MKDAQIIIKLKCNWIIYYIMLSFTFQINQNDKFLRFCAVLFFLFVFCLLVLVPHSIQYFHESRWNQRLHTCFVSISDDYHFFVLILVACSVSVCVFNNNNEDWLVWNGINWNWNQMNNVSICSAAAEDGNDVY